MANDGAVAWRGSAFIFFADKKLSSTFMSTGPRQDEIAGAYRVGDAYLWFAIHYLDSPTDYREYLPASGRPSMLLLALGLILLIVVAGLALVSGSLLLG